MFSSEAISWPATKSLKNYFGIGIAGIDICNGSDSNHWFEDQPKDMLIFFNKVATLKPKYVCKSVGLPHKD